MFNAGRQSFILSAVICLLLAALFAVRYILAPYPVEAPFTGGMPLAAALVDFSVTAPYIAAVSAGVLLVWTLIVVVQLTVKYSPVSSRNYLPAQLLLIAAGGIVVPGEALPSIVAAWLLALSMRQFVFSLHKEYRFAEVFRAGLWLGAIPLLYAPAAAACVVIVVAALAVYRRSAREALVCAVGLGIPVAAAGFIHWAVGESAGFIYHEIWRCTMEIPAEAYYTQVPVTAIGVAAIVLLLAFMAAAWALSHKKAVRKTQYKFVQHVSFTLAALLASGACPGSSFTLVPLVAVAAALPIPYAFAGKWAAASSVIYCLILTAVLALDLLPVLGFSIP